MCLGTSTHVSREAARELPGSGGALGWVLSVASSQPRAWLFPPGPPTPDSLLPAPLGGARLTFQPPGHLAACGPREAMGQLGVPGRALRLHPRLLSRSQGGGVCAFWRGLWRGSPLFGSWATWLQDELFPSLWVFSCWEGTEEGRGCCWPRRLPQAGFRRAAFCSPGSLLVITGGLSRDEIAWPRWRATSSGSGVSGGRPSHRAQAPAQRPPATTSFAVR